MKPIEFKAWFDGFSEGVDKQPTQTQWARIKERVAEIDGSAITEKIFIDRYRPYYPYPVYTGPAWVAPYMGAGVGIGSNTCINTTSSVVSPSTFSGLAAMNALGKIEIAELNGA